MLKKEKSEWWIVLPDGFITEASQFDWKEYGDLRDFYRYESAESREVKQVPAHVKMMQELELVDYEPAADPGNFRWLPQRTPNQSAYRRVCFKNYPGLRRNAS